MKIAAHKNRAVIIKDDGIIDIEEASEGRFGPDPMQLFNNWDDFRAWAKTLNAEPKAYDVADLTIPVPEPKHIFGIGANYVDHIEEAGAETPESPLIFTKFFASLAGPYDEVELPSRKVDWEVELVVVIGKGGRYIAEQNAWEHVAGYTVGQDLSERVVQLKGKYAQFSMGKSFPGFAPIGPAVVTIDEFENPDSLALGCSIDGETVQDGSTKDLIFSVPNLISRLSEVLPLIPGDLIFTGTPAGVGAFRKPRRFLRAGETLTSWVEGIGEIVNPMIEAKEISTVEVA